MTEQSYEFPARVASPRLALRELARLGRSLGVATGRRDVRAAAYLEARRARAYGIYTQQRAWAKRHGIDPDAGWPL